MEETLQIFLEKGQDAKDIGALEQLFRETLAGAGFRNFCYLNILSNRTGPTHSLFDTMPDVWWAYLRDNTLQPDEMGIQELLNATIPVHLDDAPSLATGRGLIYAEKCREFGLGSSVAIPLRGGVGEAFAVIVFGNTGRFTQGDLVMLQAACKRFHIWHKQLVKMAVPKVRLTPKQIEYLVLSSHGHTAAEIAKQSGVSVNTIRRNLDSSLERLGAHNVHGAIAKAISYNLLQGHFDIEHLAGEHLAGMKVPVDTESDATLNTSRSAKDSPTHDIDIEEAAFRLCSAESIDDIELAFSKFMQAVGLPYFTYTSLRSIDPVRYENIDQHTFLNTVPMAWLDHYFDQGFADEDPVIDHLHKGMCAENWRSIYEGGGELQKRCLREAETWGLTNGIIVPIKGGTQEVYSVSAAGAAVPLSPGEVAKIEAICHLFHHLHWQLMQDLKSGIKLSDRKLEFLQWTIDGKSLIEIGQISHLTPEGVQYHMSQLYRLLEVPNLAAAVTRSLALGIVQPRTTARRTDEA